jgi:outer membrane biosynthesis protein TonB
MKNKIISYLKNELSPQERIAFEQALATDSALHQAYLFQKAQWEKLAILRFQSKAADILKGYEAEAAVNVPKPYVFMTVRRTRFAAVAAAALLFLFNYNSLINWLKSSVPTEQNPTAGVQQPPSTPVAPVAAPPSVAPVSPAPVVEATPSVATTTTVAPTPAAKVAIPAQSKRKSQPAPVAVPIDIPAPNAPTTPEKIAEVVKEQPVKVGSDKPNDSIFLATQTQDTAASKIAVDSAAIVLDNAYDFKGDNGLISKHLSQLDCHNYTISFWIKADGTVENPKLEKGDKNCETALLNQVKTMPRLKKPISEGKPIDYRYFFTKN